VPAIVREFPFGFRCGAAEDPCHHAEHQNFGRVAAASAASARIAATRGAITLADGPDMNTQFGVRAANCRPPGDVPADKDRRALRRGFAE